jgi:hypothetical protein
MLRKRRPNQNADLLLKGIALTVFVSLLLAATVSAEDVDRKTVFEKRCTGCQALDADHEGASPRCGWETRRQYTDLQMCSSSSTKTKGILAVHNFLGSDRAPLSSLSPATGFVVPWGILLRFGIAQGCRKSWLCRLHHLRWINAG